MTEARERAVVLLSGGLDSGTSLALWVGRGGTVATCVFADYGQRAAGPERSASRRLAERFGADWREIGLPWLGDASRAAGSALADEAIELPSGTVERPGDDASARAVWVPARNVVLVAAAAAIAESIGAPWVVAGFNREEAATFPDNSAAFVSAFDGVLRLGTRSGVRLVSPTIGLDKRSIVVAARQAGFGPQDFWSCYTAGPDRCGVCESCVRAQRAFGSSD
ncbi:MAG: 7-cyano-7-deazaguanine synthase [Planctomycetes bacterium]|nr:7-cyano-7-deazaguanine synthase [Planctomycetota bacterium]